MNDFKAVRSYQFRPVGYVRSPFNSVEGMPIQTVVSTELGEIEVLPEFEDGLQGVDGFEFLILITHLHQSPTELLQVKPFLDDGVHGVFATRAPARPNKLGFSIIRLESRKGLVLKFSGNDMLNGTPVLDIKPYVPEFDNRVTQRIGWYSSNMGKLQTTKADNRMMK
jgi:tRNA-Thr(GGU) m(6)t(6)A37 methyltransferase TsaA